MVQTNSEASLTQADIENIDERKYATVEMADLRSSSSQATFVVDWIAWVTDLSAYATRAHSKELTWSSMID